jgi:hypothetical protein
MSTRDIRTSHAHTVCDVCGRTLLRGEHAETYLNGGARRSVCELCKARALNEGWVREGTLPDYDEHTGGTERRGSLLGRLRNRRDAAPEQRPPRRARPRPGARSSTPTLDDELAGGGRASGAELSGPREPRHVRAVPSSDDQKVISAAELFNRTEHRRTIAGVARSLGAPVVSIAPGAERPSLVNVVVSWELCWYRYEVDLSDEVPSVRVDAQGYELSELAERERLPNATADDVGEIHVA